MAAREARPHGLLLKNSKHDNNAGHQLLSSRSSNRAQLATPLYWRPQTTGSHRLLQPRNRGHLRILGPNQLVARE